MTSTTPSESSVVFSSSGASEATSSPLALETPKSSVSAWRETSVESNAESFAQDSEKPKKRRRKGRIIGGLREQLSKSVTVRRDIPQPQPLHIAPSSTGSRLTATELEGVLVIHLVSMASGEILAFSKPRLLDLAEIVSQVRGRAIRRENVNGYQEVLLTCLAALGESDSELTSLGWHADPFTTATAFNAFPLDADLADHRKKLRRVRAGAMVLRTLAQHQSLGVIRNPGDVLPAFRRLWALSDEHLASVFALGPGFELDPVFVTVSMFVEAGIAKLATRQAHERLDSSGREVLARAQQRYLACLKVFIFLLQPLSESPSVDLYSRGLLLNSLQQLPGWLELTVEGAVHFEKGEGVLKSADFGYDDLRRLLRFLQNVGTISARSEAYRVDLEKAMVALGVPLEAPSHTTLDRPIQLPNLPSPEESPGGADRWARVLVENALEEIGT